MKKRIITITLILILAFSFALTTLPSVKANPTIIFSSGFEDGFNSWTATSGGVSIDSSPVYSENYAMKCSDPLGSQATKTIATQSKTYTEAQFHFNQNFAGSQTLIAYFNANGNPTASMGLSVQSGKLYAYVQTTLPSYSYSQYQLTNLFPETWNKFALDASAGSATIYLNDQQLAATSLANIPAIASICVGMFWGDGSYTGNLYVDCVQIGPSAPQPTSATVFSNGFEDPFTSWTSTNGGVSAVTSPVYSGNSSMKCSDPWGSSATKSLGMQSETIAEAEFCFDQNIAGEQTLIAYFNANGNPTVSMGISVQSGRVFAFVQTTLPSYQYSQYELAGVTPGTWYKFALDASTTSATIYLYNQKLTSISQTNIPATASVSVGMFWGDGGYTGNLYVDNVQIGILPPLALPEGVAIDYYSGGECVVTLPSTWPAGPTGIVKGATIWIDVQNHEEGTYGAYDSFHIDVLGSNGKWLPLTYFATNADSDFKNLIKAVYTGMPIGNFPQNLRVGLSENDLKVERHGDRITAELLTPQIVRWPGPGFPTVEIPPFKLELYKVGGSIHWDEVHDFASYSKYVIYEDNMGFQGTGALTCSAWSFVDKPVTDCDIIMHGITTTVPPPT